jgi:V/A-type H+-transporting ATPase subunit K
MALQLPALGLVYALALARASSTVRADTPPVAARPPAESQAARGGGLTVGDGLAMLGIALATAVSVLGTGYAVAVVGASALGAITEKPELFGRTLVFIGLAEGLAIYGLIISILLLERVR